MNHFRAIIRLILICLLTCFMLIALLVVYLFKGKHAPTGYAFSNRWASWICSIIGLKVEVQGNSPKGNCIIMPNHRSYSDIFVGLAARGSSFVAKIEVRSWPILGIAAELAGTIFVNRSNPESRKDTLLQMKERLSKGYAITIFPEGTTFLGPGIKELKLGSFKLAAEGEFPIVPAAIEYEFPTDAWVGDDLFFPHFLRTFGRSQTRLKIRYGNPITHADALVLKKETETWITQNLTELRNEFDQSSA